MRMKSKLQFSHFTEVPKATQEEMKGKLTISSYWQERTSDENRRLPSTLAGLTTKTPCSRGIAVIPSIGMTPGNKM